MTNSSQQFMGLLMQTGSESPPSNLTLPSIVGTPVQQGVMLTADFGTWQGIPNPIISAIQWQGAPPPFASYAPVTGPGGTGSTYTPVAADVDNKLEIVVTVSNGVSPDAVKTSLPVGPVLPAAPEPVPPPPVVT